MFAILQSSNITRSKEKRKCGCGCGQQLFCFTILDKLHSKQKKGFFL